MKTLKHYKLGSLVAGVILLGALVVLPARSQSQTFPSQVLAQGPIDYWRLGETVASPPLNSVSNMGSAGAYGTGYVVGGVTLGQPGIVGSSAFLSNPGQGVGNCSARIDIPNTPLLNPNPPFTVEFWMLPNSPFSPTGDGSPPTGLAPISSLSVDGTDAYEGARSGYVFYVLPGSIAFRLGGPESYAVIVTATLTVSTVNWTHVVGEFDGSTGYLYINGVLAASSAASGNPFLPNPFQPMRIGGTTLPGAEYADGNGGYVVGSGNRGWDGGMDKVAIYSKLLSSNTILAHYQAGTNASTTSLSYDTSILASKPVGYWNLNEPAYTAPPANSYPFAADIGSLVDDGTNTLGALADQPGVPGLSVGDKSVFYSGEAGSLVMDSTNAQWSVFGENLGQAMTLMAWIKPDSFGYVQDIIAQGYAESTYEENFLRCGDSYDWAYFQDNNSTGNLNTNVIPGVDYYEIGTYNGGSAYVSAVFPAPHGDIGNWVFLVGTYDGVQWNLYRNGKVVGVFPDGGVGPSEVTDVDGNLLPFSVGSRCNPDEYFGMFFAGSIQEACILTNALDPATVLALYNSVGLPPVITQPPVAPSPAYLGSTVTFSVWAEGPGTLAYQWEKNGGALSGQTDTNLTLTGVTGSDDGTYAVVVTNQYGSITSSVVLVVASTLPPITVVPASETRWIGSPFSFSIASIPDIPLTFQWYSNAGLISGATSSNYTATTTSSSGGNYYVVVTATGSNTSTSSVSVLTPLPIPTNPPYEGTILGDHPLTYLQLDETSGDIAYDYAGGNNGIYFGNVTLGVPGYSLVDTDTAVYFPGQTLSYCGDIGPTNINFYGTTAEFTIEAWANGPAAQASSWAPVVCKGHENNGTTANEQFIILANTGKYEFIVKDDKGNAAYVYSSFALDGDWHLLDGVCDEIGGALTLYVDGAPVGSSSFSSLNSGGIINQTDPVTIGAESSGPGPTYDLPYTGAICQVAIYAYALSPAQVSNHFAAVYGDETPPFIVSQPVSVTNFFNFPVSLSVGAAGTQPLSYQWYQAGVGPVPNGTAATLSFPNVAYANAGTYTVGITNTLSGNVVTGIVSAPAVITVLVPATNPVPISGLVMHLPFGSNLVDVTGRGNNATNMASGGAPLLTNDYETGGPITNFVANGVSNGVAFTYQTTQSGTNVAANYASVGIRPDLQFGSNVSFTVSFWIQEPPYYEGDDLPFFGNVVGSTFGFGWCFVPTYGNYGAGSIADGDVLGSWAFSVFDASDNGVGGYGNPGTGNNPAEIWDGNFHNLVYVIDRVHGSSVYLDGFLSPLNLQQGTTVAATTNTIDSGSPATIGQDPTGVYPGANGGTFAIQDLGVWRKALSLLEVESIYAAGINNGVSFTGVPLSFTHTVLPGHELVLTWNEGQLQTSTNLLGPWTTLNVTSPYTNAPTAKSTFFRVYF